MKNLLKIVRVVLALVIFPVLGAGSVCASLRMTGLWQWLEGIQLGYAVAVMSISVFAVWMLFTLVFGRIYCSVVCPLGTLMDGAAWLRRRIRPRDYHYRRPLPQVRNLFLALWVVALVAGIGFLMSVLDPWQLFSRICAGVAAPLAGLIPAISPGAVRLTLAATLLDWALLMLVAAIAMRSGRLLCNTLCPIGTVLGYVSRYSIFQIDIDTDKCIQCRRCEHVCKACCIDLADHVVDGSRCVACFNCIGVCPNDAIHYTTDRKRLSDPMMQRIRSGAMAKPEIETSIEMSPGTSDD